MLWWRHSDVYDITHRHSIQRLVGVSICTCTLLYCLMWVDLGTVHTSRSLQFKSSLHQFSIITIVSRKQCASHLCFKRFLEHLSSISSTIHQMNELFLETTQMEVLSRPRQKAPFKQQFTSASKSQQTCICERGVKVCTFSQCFKIRSNLYTSFRRSV